MIKKILNSHKFPLVFLFNKKKVSMKIIHYNRIKKSTKKTHLNSFSIQTLNKTQFSLIALRFH